MAITSVTKDGDDISYVEDGATKKTSVTGSETVVSFPIDDCDKVINVWRQQSDGHLIITYIDTNGDEQEIDLNVSAVSDHGALAGLTDDDHSHYWNDTRGDAKIATHAAAADPHTGYRKESDDHTHQSAGAQGGKLDHGAALDGLADNDHTQYILHSLATAANDMVVASGAGAFIKKTLAEVKTLLAIASDIATHAALTATHGVAGTIADVADIVATKLDDFTTPDDNTDLDATDSLHGLMPKADKAKLDGIAAGATVYPDTGEQAFLDADHSKLDGIATGADVTGDNAPQAHKASHENAGADEVSVAGLSGLLADDQHVLDAEVQAIKLDDFTAPDDNTDLNASAAKHGLMPKGTGTANHYFKSDNSQGALHAATDTLAGAVELAIASEVNTGTDATRANTPDALAGSNFGIRYIQEICFDFTTDCVTGNGKGYVHIPPGLNGMNLVYVHVEVITAGTTGTMDVMIHNLTQAADMLSTILTVDSGETGSDTAATPYVIDGAEDDVATNDVIRVDVDAIHTTAAKGLIVTLGFQLP